MMNLYLKKLISMALLWALAITAAAHSYFFGITDLTLNPSTHKIEIIHQLTTHDLENAIAESQQISFSPEHKNYETYIQSYIEKHFTLEYLNNPIKIEWLGFEIKYGTIYIYQEAPFKNLLAGLLVKNDLLVNTYSKQINILNFQSARSVGTLNFSYEQTSAKIE